MNNNDSEIQSLLILHILFFQKGNTEIERLS